MLEQEYDKREKEKVERKGDNHMEFEAISAARCLNALEHMFAIPAPQGRGDRSR